MKRAPVIVAVLLSMAAARADEEAVPDSMLSGRTLTVVDGNASIEACARWQAPNASFT